MMNRQMSWTPVFAASLFLSLLAAPVFAITPAALEHYQTGLQLEKRNDYRGAEQEYRTALGLDPYDSLTYIRLAHVLERDGKKEEALSLYQKALELNPKDAMIHLSIAQIYESRNKWEEALSEYKKLVTATDSYPYAYLAMARLEKQASRPEMAIKAYGEFLKAYPKHFDAQRELAAVLFDQKQYDKAAELYGEMRTENADKFKDDLAYGISLNNSDRAKEALAVFEKIKTPSAVLYEQMGMSYEKLNRFGEAYQSYGKAITMAPEENYNLYLKQADLAVTLNEPKQAQMALRSYLANDPDNGKVMQSLADLYLQQKDYAAAADNYEIALKNLNTEDERVHRIDALKNLGYARQMAGNTEGAIEAYERSMELDPTPQIRLNLALAYHQKGEYQKALELYRKLIIADPDNMTLKKDMGQVLLALGEQAYKSQDYAGAVSYYQDAFMLGSEQEIPALLGLGNTQYAQKNYDMAYATYQRLLEKDPDNIAARLNKAQLDLDRENYMPALENLRWVVEKKPDSLEAYRMLAKTHEGLKDYGQAILYYKKALELQAHDTNLLVGYGNVARQVGDLNQAEQAYTMARKAAPDNAMVRYNLASVYNMTNKLEDSLAEYRAAVELNPGFAESYYGMGNTLEKQKKYTEAISVYQQFLEKAPPTSSYVPMAKERIEVLKKAVNGSAAAPATSKPPISGAKPSATVSQPVKP